MSKTTIYRQTVSITTDLKRRMDKVADQVNWSAIAATAFEIKLGEIAASKQEKDMKDVIQRLRASKVESDDADFLEGKSAGESWARDDASAKELGRLETARQRAGHDWGRLFHEHGGSAYSHGEWLASVIAGDSNLDRAGRGEVLERMIGDDEDDKHADGAFMRGFAEGALDVWAQVKHAI
jgi:hypothetical protein